MAGQETPENLVEMARAGRPLERSAELMALAEEVASQPATGFPEEWAARLAADFAQFND